MKSTSRLTVLGFLLAIATFNLPSAAAASHDAEQEERTHTLNIDQRIARVTEALEEREQAGPITLEGLGAAGLGTAIASFLNRRGGGGFVNRYGGSFLNGGGGWRNGFRNGGGFLNRRW